MVALNYVQRRKTAIDVGGGALRDTRLLLQQGFDVTVIDKDPLIVDEAKKLNSEKLHYFVGSFDAFNFPAAQYDIVTAMYSLPFNPPQSFETMFAKLKKSIRSGGVFCGIFFGVNDEWNVARSMMSFHTKSDIEQLLDDMTIISLIEDESDGLLANGTSKHWHLFRVIAARSSYC